MTRGEVFRFAGAVAASSSLPAVAEAGALVMSSGRSGHTATLLQDGRVLIAGGMLRNHAFLASTELYDPRQGAFLPAPSMKFARVGHTASQLADGTVLFVGGYGSAGVLASVERYDPRTASFVEAPALRAARGDHTATVLRDGTVLVIGGEASSGAVPMMERYDPKVPSWIAAGSLNVPRKYHAAALAGSSDVLVTGGLVDGAAVGSCEQFEFQSGRILEVGSLGIARDKHAAASLPDGGVLVTGGSENSNFGRLLTSAERYDPRTRGFAKVEPMREARFKNPNAILTLANGDVLVAGGGRTVERFVARRASFVTVRDAGIARFFATATRLPGGSVLLAGGYGNPGEPSFSTAVVIAT